MLESLAMDVSHILNSLNDQQRQAVAAPPGNLLVLAGAGSGKTRVLVHRIAWLIQTEGVSPYGILAVTFTNKAAREMRERIAELLNREIGGMWVGTFHGIAHRLLRIHCQEAGLPDNFQILDADDQLRLIKRLCNSLAVDDKKWPAKQCQWFINAQKDEGLRAAHIEDYGDEYIKTMLAVYNAYEEACNRGGMVDFGELLLRAHELWLKKPQVLRHYQGRFNHILVDEFQDTNTIQYAWLRVLAGDSGHMMVVGDDDQSIYAWRGAKIENIQLFNKDFANADLIRLEQNYRSTATILKAANKLIANNQNRLGKELWTDDKKGELISLYEAFNEQDEARFIVNRIQDWVSQGNSPSEAAILYRSNAQSRELEEALLRMQMPYRIYGGFRFYDRLEIRNALAYLRLVLNRHDDAAFERIINVPTRGIGGRTMESLRELARTQSISLWSACDRVISRNLFPNRAASALSKFVDLITRFDEETADLELAKQTEYIIAHSGLIEHHEKEKGEKARARIENLEELVNAALSFEPPDNSDLHQEGDLEGSIDSNADPAGPNYLLTAFLDKAALDAGESQAGEAEAAVQLMTLHSAKGLEFPLVFLAGLEEGLFPHKMSLDSQAGLEEERRLCYVGITRAMQKLYLCYAESRRLFGAETLTKASRFIREVPSELIQEVRLKSQIVRPKNKSYHNNYTSLSAKNTAEIPDTGLSLGQRVEHKKFGEGVILNYEGHGPNARIQVNFNSAGSKWLVVSYAKLETLG